MEQHTENYPRDQFEMLQRHPDLTAEYANEQLTVFGMTGTPEELLKLCPIPHEQMTVEAKNMFLVTAMNESEATVKPEHMTYFKDVLDTRGMEVKITVREDPDVSVLPVLSQAHDKEQVVQVQAHKDIAKASVIDGIDKHGHSDEDDARVAVLSESPQKATQGEHINPITTKQMDQWLSRMHAEYTTYVETIEDTDGTQEKNEEPRALVVADTEENLQGVHAKTRSVIVESVPIPGIKVRDSIVEHANEGRSAGAIQNDLISEQLEVGVILPTQDTTEKLVEFPGVVEVVDTDDASVESALLTTQHGAHAARFERVDEHTEAEGLPASEEDRAIGELPPSLAALLAELADDKELISQEIGVPLAGEDYETETSDNTEFAMQILDYVRSLPEEPTTPYEAQPIVLVGRIIETAIAIQELQFKEHDDEDALTQVKERLEEYCIQLLESFNVEPDERVVARMVEKILASDLSLVPGKKLSTQELAEKGTHEYKLESWFNKFKQLLDDSSHPHRLVGRVALGLTNIPT